MKLEELVFSGLGKLKKYVSDVHNVISDDLTEAFDEAEGYYVDELVEAYNQGLNEGAKHIEAWRAVAAACELVMSARMEEDEAYNRAENNQISPLWSAGKAVHSAEDLAEWRAEWAAADTRLLDAETVLRAARAAVRDLEK
jgi:predicted RecB family endonuclease